MKRFLLFFTFLLIIGTSLVYSQSSDERLCERDPIIISHTSMCYAILDEINKKDIKCRDILLAGPTVAYNSGSTYLRCAVELRLLQDENRKCRAEREILLQECIENIQNPLQSPPKPTPMLPPSSPPTPTPPPPVNPPPTPPPSSPPPPERDCGREANNVRDECQKVVDEKYKDIRSQCKKEADDKLKEYAACGTDPTIKDELKCRNKICPSGPRWCFNIIETKCLVDNTKLYIEESNKCKKDGSDKLKSCKEEVKKIKNQLPASSFRSRFRGIFGNNSPC